MERWGRRDSHTLLSSCEFLKSNLANLMNANTHTYHILHVSAFGKLAHKNKSTSMQILYTRMLLHHCGEDKKNLETKLMLSNWGKVEKN